MNGGYEWYQDPGSHPPRNARQERYTNRDLVHHGLSVLALLLLLIAVAVSCSIAAG